MKITTSLFVSVQHQSLLADRHLDNFEGVWALQVKWFEEPNQRRGGWSGVGRIELSNHADGTLCLFVKKQQNHGRSSWKHPIKGEPTFRREFKRLKFLESKQFKAPEVVFYAESDEDNNQRAVLVTIALDDYVSLENLLEGWWLGASAERKKNLLKKIAQELRRFHDLGLVHRALYPKHIFIKNADHNPEIALIDLEKARTSLFPVYRTFFDLAALNRHVDKLSLTQRLRFIMWYLDVIRLNFFNKILCRLIIKRSIR